MHSIIRLDLQPTPVASSAFDTRKIDELIWGDLESEIMEARFSLYTAHEVIKSAKVYPVQLLVGFLYFIHYKCGQALQLGGSDKAEFDGIDGDF